jgi:hypothetical protein
LLAARATCPSLPRPSLLTCSSFDPAKTREPSGNDREDSEGSGNKRAVRHHLGRVPAGRRSARPRFLNRVSQVRILPRAHTKSQVKGCFSTLYAAAVSSHEGNPAKPRARIGMLEAMAHSGRSFGRGRVGPWHPGSWQPASCEPSLRNELTLRHWVDWPIVTG